MFPELFFVVNPLSGIQIREHSELHNLPSTSR